MARAVSKVVLRRTGDAAGPITLAIDIGGSGLKIQALSPEGRPISERLRVPTPNSGNHHRDSDRARRTEGKRSSL